jgi:L-lactate utilization protein LutB
LRLALQFWNFSPRDLNRKSYPQIFARTISDLTARHEARSLSHMSKLPPARSESSEAFLAEAGLELAALCTACGACFDTCPMVDQIGLRGSDPRTTTDGLRRLAKGETASAETVAWVAACAKSGLCVTACPERLSGLDAMLLVRIAKQHALNETHQLPVKHDPTYFPRIKTFARLQLTDEELAKWL